MGATKTDAIQELLANESWLRSLARSMVQSRDVDDLVQDTYTAALETPPDAGSVRSWARSVVRRKAARIHRGDHRRRAREERAARAESVAAIDAILEARETQKKLADAVLRLPEPQRSVILMRFQDGVPPRRIAEELDLPPTQVRNLLHRGLNRLRDEAAADDQRYRKGLVALAWPGVQWSSRGVASAVAAYAVAGLLLIALAGWAFWPVGESDRESLVLENEITGAPVSTPVAAVGTPSRVAVPADTTEAQRHVRGRIVDNYGAALRSRVELAWSSGAGVVPLGSSDPEGRFEFLVPRSAGMLLPVARHRALRTTRLLAGRDDVEDVVVVAGERRDVRGVVRDETGAPLAGVTVSITAALRLPFPADDLVKAPLPTTRSAPDGSFVLAEAPAGVGVHYRFRRPDRRDLDVRLGSARRDGDDLVVAPVMRGPKHGLRMRGRVVDAGGSPIAGVLVESVRTAGRCRTDAKGRFDVAGSSRRYLFARSGFAPRMVELDGDHAHEVRLQPAVALAGRIEWSDGAPARSVEVRLENALRFRDHSCAASLPETAELYPRAWETRFTTDAQGRFRIEGLGRRRYRLRVFDPVSRVAFLSQPLRPGQPCRIVWPRPETRSVLRGRVVVAAGRPLAGARVRLVTQVRPRRGRDTGEVTVRETTTDADGAFAVRDAPMANTALEVLSRETMPWRGAAVGLPETIRLQRRCYVRFDGFAEFHPLKQRVGDLSLQLIDAQGKRVMLQLLNAESEVEGRVGGWILRTGGHAFVVEERTAYLLLSRNRQELSRSPLRLEPGQLRAITPADVAPIPAGPR